MLVIVGPTCTGKTGLAVELAKRLAPAELLNADSRQLLRGLSVGTCAPTAAELRGVPCHLLELCDPGQRFTAHDWLVAARAVLASLDAAGTRAIVVGGTGLYVRALLRGYNLGVAAPDHHMRAQRERSAANAQGLTELAAELQRRDPEGARAIDTRNPRRVIRALEILDARGGSLLAARGERPTRAFTLLGVDVAPDLHEQWVHRRVSTMFESGALLGEVSRALGAGVSREALRASGIGYAQAIEVLEGRLRADAAAAATERRTLRYAKTQRTFFRPEPGIRWLDAAALDAAALASWLGTEQTFAQGPGS